MADSLLADKRFWMTAAERAVLTFAQALAAQLAVFSIADIDSMRLHGLPWYAMISVSVVAALISVLTTIGKGSAGNAGAGVDLASERVEEPFAHNDIHVIDDHVASDDPAPRNTAPDPVPASHIVEVESRPARSDGE